MLFFSYSRGNLVVVRSVAAELRRLGYRTWLDLENLRPGERWRDAIERALAASDAMVFCLSRLSIESAWTSVELEAARRRGLPVVPLNVDGVAIDTLPPALQSLHVLTMSEFAPDQAPRRAAQSIARSVGRPAPEPAWSDGDASNALLARLKPEGGGRISLGWRSPLWQSPPAPLGAESLSELARAADEARAAELGTEAGVPVAAVAAVLGALVCRLGAGRVRLDAPAADAATLGPLADMLGVSSRIHPGP